jgi:hypothetical protein
VRVETVDAPDTLDIDGDTARRLAGEKVAFDEVEREAVQRVGGDEGGGDGVFGKDGETGTDGAAMRDGSDQATKWRKRGKRTCRKTSNG